MNANAKNNTPLHLAAPGTDLRQNNMTDIVHLLLKHGANVNAKDNKKWTAMHIACSIGHIEIAELLVQHQAQIDALNERESTPLHLASQNNMTDIVHLLLKHGANVNAK